MKMEYVKKEDFLCVNLNFISYCYDYVKKKENKKSINFLYPLNNRYTSIK